MVKKFAKLAGYTALGIAATPFVFAAYTFTLGAAWAFKHPKSTIAGMLGAGALMYGASKIDFEELTNNVAEQQRTQQLATTQRNNSLLEQKIALLEQEKTLLLQDPQRPIQYHEQSNEPIAYMIGAGLLGAGTGIGLGILGAGLYSRRNNQQTHSIPREPISYSQPRREPRIIDANNHRTNNNIPSRRIQYIQ